MRCTGMSAASSAAIHSAVLRLRHFLGDQGVGALEVPAARLLASRSADPAAAPAGRSASKNARHCLSL